MLSIRYQFLKRLFQSHSFKSHAISQTSPTSLFFPKFAIYSFSSSSSQFRQTNYTDDFVLLRDFSQEKLANASHFIDKYAKCEDLNLLTQDERTEISHVLLKLAFAQKTQGNTDKAYRYLREDEELMHKAGIKDAIHLAQNYYLRAGIYMEKSNIADSEYYLSEVERICRLSTSNSEHAKSLRLQGLCSLAHLNILKDDHDKALDLFNSIVEKINDVQESSLPVFLRDFYQGLSSIYSSRHDVEKAIDSYMKALDVAAKYNGENSVEAFSIYVDFTTFLYQHGQDELALRMGQKRLKMAQNIFSKDNIEVASSHLCLGHVQTALGDYNKALDSYKEALEVLEKTPEDHLVFKSDTYFQLMRIYCFTGDYQKALDFLTKADEAIVKANRDNQLAIAEIYFKWAQDFAELGGLAEESKNYTNKALLIYHNNEPVDKRAILEIYAHLGMSAFGEGDWEKAHELLKECEKYIDETTTPLICKMIDFYLSSACLYLNNYEECEKHAQKIIKSYEATGDDEFAGEAYNNIGIIREQKGRIPEAVEAFKKAAGFEERKEEKDFWKLQTFRDNLFRCENYLKENSA